MHQIERKKSQIEFRDHFEQWHTCAIVDIAVSQTNTEATMRFLWLFGGKERFPMDEQRQHVQVDRISLRCVLTMKSWENNRTTKQGKQIISPQTNCPLERSAHRTAYTTNLPESLDSLQQKERKILLLSQIMFIEHIFPFSESVFSFLNNLWLTILGNLRQKADVLS